MSHTPLFLFTLAEESFLTIHSFILSGVHFYSSTWVVSQKKPVCRRGERRTHLNELVDSLLYRARGCDNRLLHLIEENQIKHVQERNALIILWGSSQRSELPLVKIVHHQVGPCVEFRKHSLPPLSAVLTTQ